jgi:hypothetical protein
MSVPIAKSWNPDGADLLLLPRLLTLRGFIANKSYDIPDIIGRKRSPKSAHLGSGPACHDGAEQNQIRAAALVMAGSQRGTLCSSAVTAMTKRATSCKKIRAPRDRCGISLVWVQDVISGGCGARRHPSEREQNQTCGRPHEHCRGNAHIFHAGASSLSSSEGRTELRNSQRCA